MGNAPSQQTTKKNDDRETETGSALSTSMRLAHTGIAKKFPKVHHINTSSLQSLIERGKLDDTGEQGETLRNLVILDVRPPEEYDISHIEGSIRVDMDTAKNEESLRQFIGEHGLDKENSTIVCYCSAGYRSCFMADKLQNLLDKPDYLSRNISIKNLEGSLFQWANERREMVDIEGKSTIFVHPFNTLFGALLNRDLRKWPESHRGLES